MSWQDIVSIFSFLIGILSLIFSWVSMVRTGTIQKALQEQSDRIFQKNTARQLLPEVRELLNQVQKDYAVLEQVENDIKQNQSVLSTLQCALNSTSPSVDCLLKMISENTASRCKGESAMHTSQEYISELSALVFTVEKEVN